MNRVIAYLRVSTDKQDSDNQRYGIEEYCQKLGISVTEYREDVVTGSSSMQNREGGSVIYSLGTGDIFIVTELSRLSRKMVDMVVLIDFAAKKGIHIHAIKEGIVLKDDMTSKILSFVFGIASDLERTRISERTKESLDRKKREGIILGRPIGTGQVVIELNNYLPYIQVMLKHNISKSKIAPFIGTNRVTLNKYLNSLK